MSPQVTPSPAATQADCSGVMAEERVSVAAEIRDAAAELPAIVVTAGN